MSAQADALMGIFGFKRVEKGMKTIEQTRRELFEEWYEQYTAKGWSVSKIATWESFNAAMDAVVIELPGSIDYTGCGCAIDACRTAIESTNLGIKIR